MVTQFILNVMHCLHFSDGGVDVLISDESGDLHGNQIETVSWHRVIDSSGLRNFGSNS